MQQPIDTVLAFGDELLHGSLERMADRYNLPCVVAMNQEQRMVDDRRTLIAAFQQLRSTVVERGTVSVDTHLRSQAAMSEDLVLVCVGATYRDADGAEIDTTQTSYLVRRFGTDWRILMLTIDHALKDCAELCVPQLIAA